MRRCTKCGELKPESAFYAEKSGRDGLRSDCKTCFAERAHDWYLKNREKAIARVKAWQRANPERHRATQQAVRERRRPAERDAHLQRTFGIGSPEYDEMFLAQDGRCAICGREPRSGSSLHVDHDHEAGVIRGLLCFSCNAGLGQFKDDTGRLAIAIEYLDGSFEASSTRTRLTDLSVARAKSLVRAAG